MEQEVTAEAAPALPSASPAPGSAPEAEPAAAAPAGAAGQKLSDWDKYLEQELLQELSNRVKYVDQELSKVGIKSREEASDWEEHIGQAPSQEEASLGRDVSRGSSHGPRPHSSWEDNSDPELVQVPRRVRCDSGIWMKPLALEEDEWDELSVLELPPEEDREQKWRVLRQMGSRCLSLARPGLRSRHRRRAAQGRSVPGLPPCKAEPLRDTRLLLPSPSTGSRVPPGNVPAASGGRCGRCGGCSAGPAWRHGPRSSTDTAPTAAIAPEPPSLRGCGTHGTLNNGIREPTGTGTGDGDGREMTMMTIKTKMTTKTR
ncbi:hypothetical protein DUI87_15576 [Hirundo rustica rustica]|uniref:Uncharacterized protein n=1 Tax=Hirundo rustica rustica TaxID=333673 RepID=A0A3M0JYU4_HIRRU|nr:hypothetical protein DUI87_15576 [Hirundo rustica rustica]